MAKKKTAKTSDISDVFNTLDDLGVRLVKSADDLAGSYTLETGIFNLDIILSPKFGLSPGKIIEVFGLNGTGKSSIAFQILKSAADAGLGAYYFGMEYAENESSLSIFGLTPKSSESPDGNVYIFQPPHGEAALEGILRVIQTQPKSVIVLDSVANCMPAEQYSEQIGKQTYKSVANIMTPFITKARSLLARSESILILLNQQRANVSGYGSPYKETGGMALQFNCDWRVEVKRGDKIEKSGEKIGHVIRAITKKNRFMKPEQEARFHLVYGGGFDEGLDLLQSALELGVVSKAGAWFKMGDQSIGQGQIAAAEFISQNEEIKKQIKDQVKEMLS